MCGAAAAVFGLTERISDGAKTTGVATVTVAATSYSCFFPLHDDVVVIRSSVPPSKGAGHGRVLQCSCMCFVLDFYCRSHHKTLFNVQAVVPRLVLIDEPLDLKGGV